MCTRTSGRASKRESTWCLFALSIGIAAGAGGVAWATVACGSFDATTMNLTSVRKAGKDQPLPARLGTRIENYRAAFVYDPDLGDFRQLYLERMP